ncbi:hypothetical protein Tco_1236116 [Tanacetum coccineum]
MKFKTTINHVDQSHGLFDTGILQLQASVIEKLVILQLCSISTERNFCSRIEDDIEQCKILEWNLNLNASIREDNKGSYWRVIEEAKDKGKAKMVKPEKPLKKKDQIMFDKEVAQKLQAQLDAEFEEEEKLARQREEDANIAEWDNIQAMMDADYELAARLQAEEQGKLTIKEKSRLFVELMNKRKKHFARLREEEEQITN